MMRISTFCLLLCIGSSVFAADVPAPKPAHPWEILPERSNINFTAMYGDEAIKGSFPRFTGEIMFSDKDLEHSHVTIKVDVRHIKSSDPNAQQNLPAAEWFNAKDFPLAIFEAKRFNHIKGDDYEAIGTLSIRDKSIPLTLPFSLRMYNATEEAVSSTRYARMSSEIMLKRRDFGVGQGEWEDVSVVANNVTIAIQLEAKCIK